LRKKKNKDKVIENIKDKKRLGQLSKSLGPSKVRDVIEDRRGKAR